MKCNKGAATIISKSLLKVGLKETIVWFAFGLLHICTFFSEFPLLSSTSFLSVRVRGGVWPGKNHKYFKERK